MTLGLVFDEVAELYDRIRPGYPDQAFADLGSLTGVGSGSSVLEIGCGTGQATRSLAGLGYTVTALEPGHALAARARRRLVRYPAVDVVPTTFERWDDRGLRFDLLVAASSWHWVDPVVGWPRAHDVLRPGGWMALLGHVVVRRPEEPEMYAATADLHERFAPGNPGWGNPPAEDEARAAADVEWPGFGPVTTRWYPTVQELDGAGLADLLRTTSLYRRLEPGVREPLLDAIAERVRTDLDDRVVRRYLSVLRLAPR
ncbi:class I SAM-dependent methyltransferase [Cryptosporangium arvum]|uniref:class I SAM-dependent methyltransferase n=1 Tax=Cryptosporangium arvum TaxID=80871 RepID=UPI00056B2E6D|nr:class I SAM-dependent methyltransferase [Cryptosporangium arvum]